MRLPIFYISIFPIHVWLGIILALLIIVQILTAKKIIKINFELYHRRVIPVLIVIVLIFHAWYGLSIYWP